MQPERSNEIDAKLPNEEEMLDKKHPPESNDVIRNGQAVVATDASMGENLMATHWLIKSVENQTKIEGGVETTK